MIIILSKITLINYIKYTQDIVIQVIQKQQLIYRESLRKLLEAKKQRSSEKKRERDIQKYNSLQQQIMTNEERRETNLKNKSFSEQQNYIEKQQKWERKIEAMSQATDKKQIQIEKLRCIVKQQNNLKQEQVSDNRIYLKSILENRRSTTEQELLRVQSRSARLYEQKLHAEKMRKLFEKELLISKHLQDKKLEKLKKNYGRS